MWTYISNALPANAASAASLMGNLFVQMCGCVTLWKKHFPNFSAYRSRAHPTPPGGSLSFASFDGVSITLHTSKCQHLLKAVRAAAERKGGRGEDKSNLGSDRNAGKWLRVKYLLLSQESQCFGARVAVFNVPDLRARLHRGWRGCQAAPSHRSQHNLLFIWFPYDIFFPLRCLFVFFFPLSVGWCNSPAIIHRAEVSPMNFFFVAPYRSYDLMPRVMINCSLPGTWAWIFSNTGHPVLVPHISAELARQKQKWGATPIKSGAHTFSGTDMGTHSFFFFFFVCKLMRVHYFLQVSPFYNICTAALHKEQPSAQSL